MSVKYCESCGTSVMETMRFCPQCGHRIFSQTPVQPQLAKSNQSVSTNNTQSSPNLAAVNYAGFWERFAAHLIDSCIVGIACFLIGFVSGLFLTAGGINVAAPSTQAFYLLLELVALVFYYALMESSDKRATFGKQWLGLEVTDMNLNRISMGQGFGRYFGRWVSILLLCIGYLMQPFNAKKQTLHDIMANTLVVKRGNGKSAMTILVYSILSFIVLCVFFAVVKAINHSF